MNKRLTRNYTDPESRLWWEAAEKAGANPPKIVVPSQNDLKLEERPKTDLRPGKPAASRDEDSK